VIASSGAKQEIRVSAKVIRADGSVKKDLGVVGYWHKNPLKRLIWRIKQWLQS
jgi:hypothetical protein